MQLHADDGEFVHLGRWLVRRSVGVPRRDPGGRRQVGLQWRKSSWSNPNGACVEVVRPGDGRLLFRDSKSRHGPVLAVSEESAGFFMAALDRGVM
ncbi:DUF397 domain-containing protein [Streptomyces acidiscabies]|uniref:DUF397 domain-containing protein n=2 Tax=Streptomyces acidiscabies TaxID=42234 RepID=A0AAP6BMA1_9ACTN|nr:DUF397 domain-containing protein [Streptomyces acidiscabies]MBP5935473.1 DUF397 domain-containing protein [Streptomyces sp. LBUM 1476]MBZ3916664.1 DUF397 domain-containing protein [Streptomyces acidiscabies]MDX2967163.1 DUF397 domain-containing protein [Streptomyces acidiscabies]MDX3025433.1 DUF397 domain-containing protein [Streptomyces acidiscabies]MDX3795979.1 DUF397 domain-containing protein [Streptomyces acidiscabies]